MRRFNWLDLQTGVSVLSGSDRLQLLLALCFALPIGWFMLLDTVKRYDTDGMELLRGRIIGELPRAGIRPVVDVDVDDRKITVKATLMMDSVVSMPPRVSFYYSGDPTQEVHLREESNPLWFLLLCIAVPALMLAWDFRKLHEVPPTAD